MRRRASPILIGLAFVAFVSLGLPDCVLGVAWPSIRAEFGQPLSKLGIILMAGTSGYLCSGFLGGQIVRGIGVGRLILASALLVAVSLAGYRFAPGFGVIVVCSAIGGLAGGAIDTGINTYAARHFSPRVVNWLHASWGIGATAGPLLMTAVVATHHGWRVGYAILSGTMILLSLLFLATLGMWEDGAAAGAAAAAEEARTVALGKALGRPLLWLRALVFFVYGGIESTAGQLLFTLFTESRGIGVTRAGVSVGAYWGALTVGRIVFGQLAAWVGRAKVLRTGMGLAIVASALIAWDPARVVSFAGVVLLGFALAPIFPTLISATPEAVGADYAPHAVGFQVAATSLGIAAFPGVVSLLARVAGLEVVCGYLMGASLALFGLHELTARYIVRGRQLVAVREVAV